MFLISSFEMKLEMFPCICFVTPTHTGINLDTHNMKQVYESNKNQKQKIKLNKPKMSNIDLKKQIAVIVVQGKL